MRVDVDEMRRQFGVRRLRRANRAARFGVALITIASVLLVVSVLWLAADLPTLRTEILDLNRDVGRAWRGQ